jgi:hypothetical protein
MAMAIRFQRIIPGISFQGTWQLLVQNAGIASIHTAITQYDTAILLDRTNIGSRIQQVQAQEHLHTG